MQLGNIGHSLFHQVPPARPTFISFEMDSTVNLDDDEVLETPLSPSSRPPGIKTTKEARKKRKQKHCSIESITQSNCASVEQIKKMDEDTRNYAARVLAFEE